MQSPARVLVVDDSPTLCKVVSAILVRHGYEADTALDGLRGIQMIKSATKYDLVLLDFVMPKMNGYQFCRELRSSSAHRTMPIVLMSAKGDKIRGQFVQQTGAVDAITKPFDARALVAVVEGALSKTAEGRARPVPEGDTMPDEDTIADSARPSQLPKQLRMRASIEVAQRIAAAVVPAVLGLPDDERNTEAGLMRAVARSLSPETLAGLARVLRDLGGDGPKDVLSGEIGAIPVAEVLQVLSMQRQTGVIRVANARTVISLWMRQGLVDLVQSRGASDEFRLGRYFLEQGILTKEELEAVLRKRDSDTPRLIGDLLVETGKVSSDQLRSALEKQSSELVYDMLRWRYGRFSFIKEPLRAEANAANLGLGVSGLVLEGFRRVDEWRLMEGTIVFDQVVYVDEGALESVGKDKLTRSEQLVLGAVDKTRTISDVVKESTVSSFDAIKIIYQFLQSRVLRARTRE
jgi:DNA-binding response OmpR family regulator